jgi:hypothetical protein
MLNPFLNIQESNGNVILRLNIPVGIYILSIIFAIGCGRVYVRILKFYPLNNVFDFIVSQDFVFSDCRKQN